MGVNFVLLDVYLLASEGRTHLLLPREKQRGEQIVFNFRG
jgi:hypothetical protein